MKNVLLLALLTCATACFCQTPGSLVPSTPSKAPDYFCTWNIQGYLCSYISSEAQRSEMTGQNMLGDSLFQNWLSFYPLIKQDLFFVMDDSWDIPLTENKTPNQYLGRVELDETRFPQFKGTAAERMQQLAQAVKAKGWKGLGGWVCAKEAPAYGKGSMEDYWKQRLQELNQAGFSYFKVDWGTQANNGDWRKKLTQLGHTYAPNLTIEHAMQGSFISFSDAYRTYDVENVISQPTTIARIANLLTYKAEGNAKGIINCEDEPYIAAGLGCAMGIMRHPFTGNLPNGTIDFVFPPVGRNIKLRMDEVVRAVRWHRIAEPFGVDGNNYTIDSTTQQDWWVVGYRDTWGASKVGDTLKAGAPARVSRGLPLPIVTSATSNQPFVLSSLYPNGCIAIATIGRGINREYVTQKINVQQWIPAINHPIGVFGDYASLTLTLPTGTKLTGYKVWAQDLAGETPVDITNKIAIQKNTITIPGNVIRQVGLSAKTAGDLSDPGLVMRFIKE